MKLNSSTADMKDLSGLKEEITSTKNMVSREWLLEKAEEINKAKKTFHLRS
ncbi:MAG: hypothetical protein L0Y79_10045 [Chlorobi bacterium]|nr:hypothetical protein [Chlorobiota bacterium]MCI0715210.1 hypothetical protein [Chlorobiota bacterium]